MSKKRAVIQKVIGFLTEHKDTPREIRGELVRQLTDELIEQDGYTPAELRSIQMKHPGLLKKPTLRRHSILEVLADFIMAPRMIEERKAEYPVMNVRAEMRREAERERREVPFIMEEEDDLSKRVKGAIYEYEFEAK